MSRPGPGWRAVHAGCVFGLGLLAAGWIFGPLRAGFVAPRLGPVGAVLLEGPLLLGSAVLLVWILRQRGWLPGPWRWRLIMSLAAFATLIAGEAIGAAMVLGPEAGAAPFQGLTGAIGLGLAAACALIPVVGRGPA